MLIKLTRVTFVITCIATIIGVLTSCGGSPSNGDIFFSGQISQADATRILLRNGDRISGITVSAGGGMDVTNANGEYGFYGYENFGGGTVLVQVTDNGRTRNFSFDDVPANAREFLGNFIKDGAQITLDSSSVTTSEGDSSTQDPVIGDDDDDDSVETSLVCSQGTTICQDGNEVCNENLCDGAIDCVDGSDEAIGLCGLPGDDDDDDSSEEQEMALDCVQGTTICQDATEICAENICDGKVDCADGSDEALGLCGLGDDDDDDSTGTTCYCDDGFGPVSPSTICLDTGKNPTNCS